MHTYIISLCYASLRSLFSAVDSRFDILAFSYDIHAFVFSRVLSSRCEKALVLDRDNQS